MAKRGNKRGSTIGSIIAIIIVILLYGAVGAFKICPKFIKYLAIIVIVLRIIS